MATVNRNGDIEVMVTGLHEAMRALKQAGADMSEMNDLMHEIGEIVARRARSLAPVRTGRLRASLRAGKGRTKAVIRAGYSTSVPYAGVIEYGWPKRNIAPHPFLIPARDQTWNQVQNTFENGLTKILTKNGLT